MICHGTPRLSNQAQPDSEAAEPWLDPAGPAVDVVALAVPQLIRRRACSDLFDQELLLLASWTTTAACASETASGPQACIFKKIF